ncbi:unnamed protein product [Ectocarpus sp. 4 AP-2014]
MDVEVQADSSESFASAGVRREDRLGLRWRCACVAAGLLFLLSQAVTGTAAFAFVPRVVLHRTAATSDWRAAGKQRGTQQRTRALVAGERRVFETRTVLKSSTSGNTASAMDGEQENAKIIDGKATAAAIRAELKGEVEAHVQSSGGPPPGLAVVLVGDRRDSATYVRMKKKACDEIGVSSFGFDFPEDVTQDELLACVGELNSRPDVHGILVQLPLPKHIDEQSVLQAITPSKDVDGLHPANVAALCTGRTRAPGQAASWQLKDLDFHVPCTPQGCIELLDRYGVEIAGKRAVVLGRSNIVGIPVSMLLMHRDATVTMTHSKTVDIASVVSEQ